MKEKKDLVQAATKKNLRRIRRTAFRTWHFHHCTTMTILIMYKLGTHCGWERNYDVIYV